MISDNDENEISIIIIQLNNYFSNKISNFPYCLVIIFSREKTKLEKDLRWLLNFKSTKIHLPFFDEEMNGIIG